jgi:hypothetical protein
MLPGTPTSSRGVDDRDARARIEKAVLAPRPLGRLPAVGDPVDAGQLKRAWPLSRNGWSRAVANADDRRIGAQVPPARTPGIPGPRHVLGDQLAVQAAGEL